MSIYRILAYVLLSLITLLFVILPGTLLLIAHSPSASQWMINSSQRFLPSSISFGSFSGSLAGPFKFEDFALKTAAISASFDDVEVNWDLWQLMDGELYIQSVGLGKGEIRLRESQTDGSGETNLENVRVELPIALTIDTFSLAESWFFINQLPQQKLAITSSLSVSQQGDVNITDLSVNHQYANLVSNLTLRMRYPFAFDLTTQLDVHSPDYPKTAFQLNSNGAINQLSGDVKIRDSLDLDASFQASDVLTSPRWNSNIILRQTLLNEWLNAFGATGLEPLMAAGEIKLRGSPSEGIQIRPRLDLNYSNSNVAIDGSAAFNQQQLLIDELSTDLTGPIAARIHTSGQLDFSTAPIVDLRVDAEQINYQGVKTEGTIFAKGALDNLRINADTRSTLPSQEQVSVQTTALLEQTSLTLEQLSIEETAFSGKVTGSAKLSWKDQLKLRSSINGTLFEKPVSLQTDVVYASPYVTVNQLDLDWQASELNASGRLAPGQQLQFSASIPKLSMLPLLNSIDGDVTVEGVLEGDITSPWAKIELTSQHLNIEGNQASAIRAQFEGSQSQHQLSLGLNVLGSQWQLNADNQVADSELRLRLNEFSVDHESLAPLSLINPADINFDWLTKTLTINSFCLTQDLLAEPACISASTEAAITQLNVDSPALDTALLNPFFANAPIRIDGNLSSSANVGWSWKDTAIASLDMDLAANNLTVAGLEESFSIDTFALSTKSTGGKIHTDLNASSSDIGLTASGRALMSSLSSTADINANFDANLNDIGILEILSPTILRAQGTLNANLAVDGKLNQLNFKPSAKADIRELVISPTGTLIRDTQLSLSSPDDTSRVFELDSQGYIGDGEFSLVGNFDVTNQKLQAKLEGNNLKVLDTPELMVMIAPDLSVDLAAKKLTILGDVRVPEAQITPPEMNNVVRPSSDVVIKQESIEKTTPITTQANINLVLGNNVNVSAYGFEGQLEGKLNINQDVSSVARGDGKIGVKAGTYEVYGQELSIERGQLIYNGGPLDNPGLNLQVVRKLPDVTGNPERVGAQVQGTLQEPTLTLFSEPAMPDASVLSYLMFGRSPNNPGESSNLELQAALLLTGDMADSFTQSLKDTFGFDDVAIDSSSNNVNDTSLYIGKYITPRLYIKYGIGLVESTSSFFLRYQLSDHFWIESTSSTESQGGDIIYSIEK